MILIRMPDELILQAKTTGEKLLKLHSGQASSRPLVEDREFIGVLGELGFGLYLDYLKIKSTYGGYVDDKSYRDPYDYKINSLLIDVKTSHRYRVPIAHETQLKNIKNKGINVCVGATCSNPKFIELHGWCTPSDLVRVPQMDNTRGGIASVMYACPLEKMRKFKIDNITL